MKVDDAEARLLEILNSCSFELGSPDPNTAWVAFQKFVLEPVECEDDGILFQIGCYDFTGEALCYFDFVRQFVITDEDGEYEHMEQIHIQFTCKPTPELMNLEATLWAYDFQSLDEYFEKVQSLPEFQAGARHPSWKCEIYQEMV